MTTHLPDEGTDQPYIPALEACVTAPGASSAAALTAALETPRFTWGALIELAIDHKALCLLAHALEAAELVDRVPHRIERFFARSLRTNQHATGIYRRHAAEITAAASAAALPVAAVGGIAVEQSLYGGSGARELRDIDLIAAPTELPELATLLTSLGYTQRPGRPTTFLRACTDLIIPVIAVDLTCSPAGIPAGELLTVLDHCQPRPILGMPGAALPVLAPRDYDRHLIGLLTRARAEGRSSLVSRADQARLRARHPRIAPALNGTGQ